MEAIYTGSTNNLTLRVQQHQDGMGANHTKRRLPVELVYYEEFDRIDDAYYREKQVQGWCRNKKKALIANRSEDVHLLAECKNESHFRYKSNIGGFGSAQSPKGKEAQAMEERET